MSLVKLVVVEDDKILLKDLVADIKAIGTYEIVKASKQPKEILELLDNGDLDFDLLVTDIEMPEINGLQLCAKAQKPTLFISGKTAEHIKTIEDFNFNAPYGVDHVTKPVSSVRLRQALEKLSQAFHGEKKQSHLFKVKRGNERGVELKINFSEIRRISSISEGRNNKVCFLESNAPVVLLDYRMEELMSILPKQSFCQIGQSDIISRDAIAERSGMNLSLAYEAGKHTSSHPQNTNVSNAC